MASIFRPDAVAAPSAAATGARRWRLRAELEQRQPLLAIAAQVALIAMIPCLLAAQIDPRTTLGISGWIKPAKFFLSFAVYYATLAWFFGYLPPAAQRGYAGRFVIWAALLAGLLEMIWIVGAAIAGVPSHFNRSPAWAIAYNLAGAGAVTLISAILVQGLLLMRHGLPSLAPALRWSLVAGCLIAFGTTLVVAGALAQNNGHLVGAAGDMVATSVPLLGWSRAVGDLRVAHFWALHAQQLVPLAGALLVAMGLGRAKLAVVAIALGYVAFVAFTFAQALGGRAFIG